MAVVRAQAGAAEARASALRPYDDQRKTRRPGERWPHTSSAATSDGNNITASRVATWPELRTFK
jgi:hypothetical protein